MLTFVETKLFTQLVQGYLSDDAYAALQAAIIANPEAGDVIRGSGGVGNYGGVWPAAGSGVASASSTTCDRNGVKSGCLPSMRRMKLTASPGRS